MISEHDRAMTQLHTRYVRGEELTPDQRAWLEAWYTEQDALEAATLHIPSASSLDLLALQREVDNAMARLVDATGYVQQLAQQNTLLRQQIAHLEQRLASRSL